MIDNFHRLIHDSFGLIRFLAEVPVQPSEPSISIAIADAASPAKIGQFYSGQLMGSETIQGAGAGINRESAIYSAVGECVERYAASMPLKGTIRSTYRELGESAVDPSAFILFSDEQYAQPDFRFSKPKPDDQIDWVLGTKLDDEAEVYIPSCFASLYSGFATSQSSLKETPSSQVYDMSYSTGMAGGPNLQLASISGLMEVIERDSFVSCWATKTSGFPLDETVLEAMRSCSEFGPLLNVPHYNSYLSNLTSELGIPVVMCVTTVGDLSGIALGCAANTDIKVAARKALLESLQTYNWIIEMRARGIVVEKEEEITDFRDHVAYYMSQSDHKEAEFLFSTSNDLCGVSERWSIKPGLSDQQKLEAVVDRLVSLGYSVYRVDLTPPEIADLGFSVVKMFVPGLQPLYCGTGFEHQDTRRISSFCKAAGIERPDVLNKAPHPFP